MSALARQGNAAADLCGLLAEVLSFPGPQLEAAVREGTLREAIEHLNGHLGYELLAPLDAFGPYDVEPKQLEAEYIRLFDVPDKAPTPLYTGVYAPRRRDAMEELLRFYRFFGLSTEGGTGELPDFVPTVLEFLGFLSLASERGGAVAAARMDVFERHLHPWAAQTAERLARRDPHPFYAGAIALVREMTAAELYLARS